MTIKEIRKAMKETQESKDVILCSINDLAGSMSCSAQIKRGRLNKMLLRRTRKMLWLKSHLDNDTYISII